MENLEEIAIAFGKVAIESKNVTIEDAINNLKVKKNTKSWRNATALAAHHSFLCFAYFHLP